MNEKGNQYALAALKRKRGDMAGEMQQLTNSTVKAAVMKRARMARRSYTSPSLRFVSGIATAARLVGFAP